MTVVVVTGAGGFIGCHTVRKLLAEGYKVKAVDKNLIPLASNPNLTVYQLDICNGPLSTVIEAGDKVLHLGAIAHFIGREDAAKAVQVNVVGTINVLETCLKKHAERVVYSSTGSVYSPHATIPIREDALLGPSDDNYYGWSKLQAEQWIQIYQRFLPAIILRYAYVYGPQKDWGAIGGFIKNIQNGEPPIVFGGRQTNDFIYVKDVVDANLLALETAYINQIYNIGTGRATSIKDACDLCLKALKSNLKMTITPTRTFDVSAFVYDISKAQSILKFEPKWTLYDGIEDMVR